MDFNELYKTLESYVLSAKEKGIKIKSNLYGVVTYYDKKYTINRIRTCCPIGCLLLGKYSTCDLIKDAARELKVVPLVITEIVEGFDSNKEPGLILCAYDVGVNLRKYIDG